MTTTDEAARIAAAVNVLRPTWPTKSVQTLILERHAHRPARHVLLALMWCVLDPETKTPARIDNPGPWWDLTNPAPTTTGTLTPPRVLACPDHGHPEPCPSCTTRPMTAADRTALRAALTRQPENDPQEMTA